MRLLPSLAALALLAAGTGWWLTAPKPLPDSTFAGVTGDATHGEQVFTAAGCASCHMAPGAEGEAQRVLSGGQRFASPFGTFLAPNISPDPTHGIGGWTLAQFGNAVMRGVSPEGEHYYPAFPYSAFNKMTVQDLADLKAFMDALPPDATPSLPHEVGFPFNIRRSLGGWKLLFLRDDWVIDGTLSEPETRGRYIAEALAHCGECHTPRNLLGGLERGRWLAGAPNPSGQGTIPNITPAKLGWSEDEIVEYLTSGFTPEFDSVGGHMAHVVENMSRLPESDRQAVAAYLKKVPASE
ncbi:mono/diheme cytochrome c family protein [Gemmobacter caeni]|uniref:Mono/diheme cytochrome c family protein n=1 Tax=Gemmobacter caeni TaxID=589035 RepID=A0A2T6BAP5_9RHOB|nr:cytochrome c [Gemmobacter caeni]PTX53144.1 mono/diheme cytochrome c family protein [Gemmobacter caeni]TWJ05255.1 mono/diheme cytochrome c family protein [Gemmobacter caeni]